MFETLRAGNFLLADRAYDSNALREQLAEREAWGNIRAMPQPYRSAGLQRLA
jgi:hypothetical protein